MKRMIIVMLTAIVAGTAVPGCSEETKTAGDPMLVVRENIRAMNSRDLEKTMATIDEQSESYDKTKELARQLFAAYDLRYELDSANVIEKTEEEAKVECVQTTRKVSGPAFRDNRIRIVHLLRNVDGEWKIYGSQMKKIDYLD
ncbi:MAG: hypothetical protein NTZ35_05555 [Ignavibacteriales bacterium]|nr:hypothetical protein [Ignavibacteriales bacterium]